MKALPRPNSEQITWMRKIRRHLHRHPELAFAEFATARFIAEQPRELDIPFTEQVNRTGIVAGLGSARHTELHDGPAHSPRFDFDERVLPTGALFLAQTAVSALEHMAELGGPAPNKV